ncbi:MAG: COP23 domain-containing protein [Oculatellaceae cyanobacterium bins.114]|nr:COP23 domain-containing protein [Oculatellaceae cyanobacterium bins.114]
MKLFRFTITLLLGFSSFNISFFHREQAVAQSTAEYFYCDESRNPPVMALFSNRQRFDFITFTSAWTPPPYSTPLARCRAVSQRFQNALVTYGENLIYGLTFSYINNQPVLCVATNPQNQQQGFCRTNDLLLTFQNELQGCLFVPAFAGNLLRQFGNTDLTRLQYESFEQQCRQSFSDRVGLSSPSDRQNFISLNAFWQDTNQTSPPSSQQRFILEERGALTRNDPILNDGSSYDEYYFQGSAGQSVVINLSSSDFDTYLLLYTQNGQNIGENDDINGSNTNSQMVITLPYTGRYRVIVNSYDHTGLGRYLLTIR